MSSPPLPASRRRLRRPGATGRRVLAIGVALVVAVAGTGLYLAYSHATGRTTLTIYTYASFLGGACGSGGAAGGLFANFSAAYDVAVQVECPSGTLVSTLESQASSPVADLVVGLDEITAPEAQSLGLLVPYSPPGLADVNASLVDHLSPQHYVTPYEYGYLAIDYTSGFYHATGGAVARSAFPAFAANASWASQLVYEDPAGDITGQEFLAWEAMYYTAVLHENWTGFWDAVLPHAHEAPSWDTAYYSMFENPYATVVSYTTDPASAAYYGAGGSFNSTVSTFGGRYYGWQTLYGVGIVRGTTHLALDEAFVNYLLNGSVQSAIPYNEWEYPANSTVPWPPLFLSSGLLPPDQIVALNNDLTPTELAQNFTSPNGWLATWQGLAGA